MPKTEFHPLLPFYTLVKKEILRFLSVAVQTLITPVITASLYLLVFGVSLGSQIQIYEEISYVQFVVPGLILMGVVNNSFANSSSSLFFSRYIGNIVDLLVTPITPAQFLFAFTFAAMIRGILVGCCVLVVSLFFTSLPYTNIPQALAMLFLSSFFFSLFGIIAGIYSNTFDNISMFTNFLILPLIYTGGLFYPVSHLPPVWQNISHLNPISYLIDGFRQGMVGVATHDFWVDFVIALGMCLFVFIWAWIAVKKGHRMRT